MEGLPRRMGGGSMESLGAVGDFFFRAGAGMVMTTAGDGEEDDREGEGDGDGAASR